MGAETVQEGWERRHAHLHLDNATLRAMLAEPFPGHEITAAEPLSGGLANTNYRVTLAGRQEPLVVRVFTRDPAACQREVALWRLVHERVPVPEILHADYDGAVIGQPYLVARWVEGVKLDDLLRSGEPDEIAAAAGAAVGATLTALGSYSFPAAGFFSPDLSIAEPLAPPAEACIVFVREGLSGGRPVARLGDDLTQRLLHLVNEHATLLDAVDPTPRLTHCDYKAQNLLVRCAAGGWETAAVLDWEFAAATSPLFDLGILLRYSDRLPPAFEQGVLAGYRGTGGALPPDWKRVIRLMDLVNLLTFLDMPDADAAMIGEVTGLVRATVERWDDIGG